VQGSLLPPGTWEAGRELLDYVVLGIGILPLVCAVAWVPAALVRPASRAAHAYAVLLTGTVAALILATGSFSVRYTAGPNDRYLFYIAPLLFLGMVALLLDRRPAPWRLLGAGVVAAMLLGAGEYMLTGPSLTSSAAAWHAVLQGHLDVWAPRSGLGHMQTPALAAVAALLLSGGLAYARWLLPVQTVGWVAIALVGLYCVAETNYTLGKIESTQKDVDRSGIVAQRTWLDKAASGQDVALVLALQSDPDTTRALYWDTAFWNKSARRTFAFEDDPNYDQGYTQRFGLLRDSGAITGLDGWRLLARAQEDRRFGIEGARKVAETPAFALYRVPAKLWAPWSMRSLDGTGRTPAGTTTTLTVSPRPDGARTVRLRLVLTTTFQATVPYRYVLSASGGAPVTGTVPAGRTRTPAVDVTLPPTGPARVALRVRGPKLLSPSGTPHGLVVLNVGVRPR
jgi:hypothetical protein